jgi:hypothetical protein
LTTESVPFIATNDNAGQTVLTDSQVNSPFNTTNVSTGQTILTDSVVNSLFSTTNVSTSQTMLTDSEVIVKSFCSISAMGAFLSSSLTGVNFAICSSFLMISRNLLLK